MPGKTLQECCALSEVKEEPPHSGEVVELLKLLPLFAVQMYHSKYDMHAGTKHVSVTHAHTPRP